MKNKLLTAFLCLASLLCGADEVTWKHVGAGMGGNSFWLTVAPTNDKIRYYTPDVGGVYKSSDGGKSWQKLATGFLHERRGMNINIVTIAPTDENTVYGVSLLRLMDYDKKFDAKYIRKYGNSEIGMVKSTDGGKTWQMLENAQLRVAAIAIDPADKNTLWTAAPGYLSCCRMGFKRTFSPLGEGTVSRSTDGGKSWTHVYVGCKDGKEGFKKQVCFSDIIVDPNSPKGNRTLYVSGNRGIFKSTDHGNTWTPVTEGLTSPVVNDMDGTVGKNGKLVLLAAVGTRMYREGITEPLKKQFAAWKTPIKAGIFRSDDGGKSWKDISGNLEDVDRYQISVEPKNPDVAYTANIRRATKNFAKGIWKTENGGKSWKRVMSSIYREQKNLTRRTWNFRKQYIASPDSKIVISQTNPRKVLFADAGCILWESDNGGKTWRTTSCDQVGDKRYKTRGMDNSYILQMSSSPKNPDFLVMSCHDFDLLSSIDGGKTFFSGGQTGIIKATNSSGGTIGFFAVKHDPDDPNVCYAGAKGWDPDSSEGGVFVTSIDGGRTWRAPIANPAGMRQGKLSDILSQKILKKARPSYRGAKALQVGNWKLLHNWAIQQIEFSKTKRLFVVKRTGIYYSDDKGGHWKRSRVEGIGLDCHWSPSAIWADPESGLIYAQVSYMPLTYRNGLFSGGLPRDLYADNLKNISGIYVSKDNGVTFRKHAGIPGIWQPFCFAVADGGKTLYAGTRAIRLISGGKKRIIPAGLFKSVDGGKSWKKIFNCRLRRLEGCVQRIAVNPRNPDILYITAREAERFPSLGGIYRSLDGGKTWQDISGEASHYTYSWLSLAPHDPSILYVGAAGSGAWIGKDHKAAAIMKR